MSDITVFEDAAEEAPLSLPRQFLMFLKESKKWWLLPIVLFLGAISLLALFASTGAAPFVYTMF